MFEHQFGQYHADHQVIRSQVADEDIPHVLVFKIFKYNVDVIGGEFSDRHPGSIAAFFNNPAHMGEHRDGAIVAVIAPDVKCHEIEKHPSVLIGDISRDMRRMQNITDTSQIDSQSFRYRAKLAAVFLIVKASWRPCLQSPVLADP